MNITIETANGDMIVNTSATLNNEEITEVISSMTTPYEFEQLIESDIEWSTNYDELVKQIKAAL